MAALITRLTAPEVAAAVAELPPMPSSIQEVISACDDQDMTVGQLSQVVLRDQSLTANILKLANSSFYGHARRVTTVTEAVVMLGFSAIKSLAISSHTARLLSGSLPGYGLQQGELWRHSISVAFTARRLAVEVQLAPVEEAFVAGLLLDIGKTILSSYMENAFDEVTRISQERRVPFHEVEAELLGFDHAELGAQIASSWSFPPELEEAIRFHHSPSGATLKPALAHCVHLADAACMMLGVGLGGDGLMYGMDPASLAVLDITPDRLMRLMDDVGPLVANDPFGPA
ncbi:MAG: HDOD domain-containing protein [Thermoleophilia bacterium]|nr:HDOD domain-containing protein [Thermoleophilia bacterium]